MTKSQEETRTVRDPFAGKDVQISERLVDRLRGKYASGPHLPNGNPEFGWRQFQSPPIQHEAAARIEELEARIERLAGALEEIEKPTYGTEIFDSDAEIADVYRSHVRRFQHIARRALSGEPTP
jgi:hypothetical protein